MITATTVPECKQQRETNDWEIDDEKNFNSNGQQ